MKLIIEYSMLGAEEPYNYDLPIEYFSKEDLIKDFDKALRLSVENKSNFFFFGLHEFFVFNFLHFNIVTKEAEYTPPVVSTLEEWFERNKISR